MVLLLGLQHQLLIHHKMNISFEQINLILAFLQRVQLQGNEAPKFMECIIALQSEIKQQQEEK